MCVKISFCLQGYTKNRNRLKFSRFLITNALLLLSNYGVYGRSRPKADRKPRFLFCWKLQSTSFSFRNEIWHRFWEIRGTCVSAVQNKMRRSIGRKAVVCCQVVIGAATRRAKARVCSLYLPVRMTQTQWIRPYVQISVVAGVFATRRWPKASSASARHVYQQLPYQLTITATFRAQTQHQRPCVADSTT